MDKFKAYEELTKLKARGIDVTEQITKVSKCKSDESVPNSVLEFINDHGSEAFKFFENLKRLSSEKNHRLYSNIINENLSEVGKLKCLSSYLTTAVIQMESYNDPKKLLELRSTIGLEVVSNALSDYYSGRDYNKINEAMEYLRRLIK